jgi:hypothetical protein
MKRPLLMKKALFFLRVRPTRRRRWRRRVLDSIFVSHDVLSLGDLVRASLAFPTIGVVPDIAVAAEPRTFVITPPIEFGYAIVRLDFQDIARNLTVAIIGLVLVLGVVAAAVQVVRPLPTHAVRTLPVAYTKLEACTCGTRWYCLEGYAVQEV